MSLIGQIETTIELLQDSWGYPTAYNREEMAPDYMYNGYCQDPMKVFDSRLSLIDLTNELGLKLTKAREYYEENHPIRFDEWLVIKNGQNTFKQSFGAIVEIIGRVSEQFCCREISIFGESSHSCCPSEVLLGKEGIPNTETLNKEFYQASTAFALRLSQVTKMIICFEGQFSEFFSLDERTEIDLFYDYFREYCKTNRKDTEHSLKRKAEGLKEHRNRRLCDEDWSRLIPIENNYYESAHRGMLQRDGNIEDAFTNRDIHIMNNDRRLLDIIRDNFGDEELFDFDRAFSKGLITHIKHYNLDTFCNLILRGDIIRYNVFPELKVSFDNTLIPPNLRLYLDSPPNPGDILCKGDEINKKAKHLIVEAFQSELQGKEDKMLICLFKVMQDHELTEKRLSEHRVFATAMVKWKLFQKNLDETDDAAIRRLDSSLGNKVSELRSSLKIKGRKELPLYKSWQNKCPLEYDLCESIARKIKGVFPCKRLE